MCERVQNGDRSAVEVSGCIVATLTNLGYFEIRTSRIVNLFTLAILIYSEHDGLSPN